VDFLVLASQTSQPSARIDIIIVAVRVNDGRRFCVKIEYKRPAVLEKSDWTRRNQRWAWEFK
jgi:hypothetical protein